MDGARLVGCDVDERAIEWCRANIPGITFHQNRLEPPLEFADDDSFDVILAASVFTHVPINVQRRWLLELRRVLRPGGLFLCTIEGWFNHRRQLTDVDRATLRRDGHVTLDKDSPNASLSTKALGSRDVFQTRDRVVEAYGSVLEILDYIPSTQDLLVLRKPLATSDLPRQLGARFYPELTEPLGIATSLRSAGKLQVAC
jgi:SAM-dependent methyltransferase